ncbi:MULTISPECIES: ATP-grasp domain-containing protein [Acaryochloris]|uniref:ATP-grasp domain-containing protein n=1 Tax=Acaryochloris TaxID=155977 RepID=UPI001F45D291|nr:MULTISPECIES: ATP-grasp domain-containing protein [Acaryochloris]
MKTTWIVQSNIPKSDSVSLLQDACEQLEQPFYPVMVQPGQKHLPELSEVDPPLVFHGVTTLILRAREDAQCHKGVFYDPQNFTHAAYTKGFGNAYLNYDAQVLDWSSLLKMATATSAAFFIKPPDDLKAFTGCVARYEDIRHMHQKLLDAPHHQSENVVVGQWYEVDAEWRLFVVNGEVVTGSMYRPTAEAFLPQELVDFAAQCIARWTPADVFVLDIGRVDRQWRIIECNCFNWSRFYLSDVTRLVDRVSRFQEDNW